MGLKGATGEAGTPGVNGEKGIAGATGSKGRAGLKGQKGGHGYAASVYTRWGRDDCPSTASLVYSGK